MDPDEFQERPTLPIMPCIVSDDVVVIPGNDVDPDVVTVTRSELADMIADAAAAAVAAHAVDSDPVAARAAAASVVMPDG